MMPRGIQRRAHARLPMKGRSTAIRAPGDATKTHDAQPSHFFIGIWNA